MRSLSGWRFMSGACPAAGERCIPGLCAFRCAVSTISASGAEAFPVPTESFLEKCRQAGTHAVRGRLKHFSYGTEGTYLPVIRRFIKFRGGCRHPRRYGRVGDPRLSLPPDGGAERRGLHAERGLQRAAVSLPGLLHIELPAIEQEWALQYVFPASRRSTDPHSGAVPRHHLAEDVLQRVVRTATRQAGVAKKASCHTFGIQPPPTCRKTGTTSTPCRSWRATMTSPCRGLHALSSAAVADGMKTPLDE